MWKLAKVSLVLLSLTTLFAVTLGNKVDCTTPQHPPKYPPKHKTPQKPHPHPHPHPHPKPPTVKPPPVYHKPPPHVPKPPTVKPPPVTVKPPSPPVYPMPPPSSPAPVVPMPPSPPTETPCPPPPPSSGGAGCPVDTLKLVGCVDVLGGLVHAIIGGGGAKEACCPVLQGVADLDAALCLCTTIRAKLLNINIVIPIALQVLIDDCGKHLPSDFQCPA